MTAARGGRQSRDVSLKSLGSAVEPTELRLGAETSENKERKLYTSSHPKSKARKGEGGEKTLRGNWGEGGGSGGVRRSLMSNIGVEQMGERKKLE